MTTENVRRESTLQNNLLMLEKYYPYIYSTIKETLPTTSISFSTENNKSINITSSQKQTSISEQARKTALSKTVRPKTNEPCHLIIGIGVGDELLELFNTTHLPVPELPNYKLPIYVIEPEPAMLIATMWLHDLRELFKSQRILWFIGENSPGKFAEHFKSRRQAMIPTNYIAHWHPEGNLDVQASIQHLYEAINNNRADVYQLKIKNNNYYNKFSADEWHKVFSSSKKPLRVMGWTSRFTTFLQYCMRDLLSGFERLGHETLLYIEESDISRTTQQDMLTTINEFKPDLILIIDHFRNEYPFIPTNIPFVNWIQDILPNIKNPSSQKFSPLDFTFVFASSWAKELKKTPVYASHEIKTLHLGINQNTYHPIKDIKKTFDVLYVSHLISSHKTLRPLRAHKKTELITNQEEKNLIESGHISYEKLIFTYELIIDIFDNLLIDELWKHKIDPPTHNLFISGIIEKANIPDTEIIREYFLNSQRIYNDICFAIKTRPLKALIQQGVDVRIYGNNWSQVKELATCAHGTIENGTQLNYCMNQARICLNNSPGISLHMRALEILGSGCFMLSREIFSDESDIKDYFKKDEEIFFFKNELDIKEIIGHWLTNNETYRLSLSAHNKAMKLFNYTSTANKIIGDIHHRLKTMRTPTDQTISG